MWVATVQFGPAEMHRGDILTVVEAIGQLRAVVGVTLIPETREVTDLLARLNEHGETVVPE